MQWCTGRQPPGAVLYSSHVPSELLRWVSYDDSTVNIVAGIIIVIIIIVIIFYF